MHLLTRIVRFLADPHAACVHGTNGFGGKPAWSGMPRYFEIEVRCAGEPDAKTGYLINIKQIDEAVHRAVVPRVVEAIGQDDPPGPTALVGSLLDAAREAVPGVCSIAWRLTPALVLERDMESDTVLVRQRFEFSAAHRLHVPSLSDDENRRLFGKCNNPAGHGHNYRVEPAIAVDPARPLPFDTIERIVQQQIIEPFDHKHLNEQTDEFGGEVGLNPSVENIAMVCFRRLEKPVREAGAALRSVTVWETDRTSSTYPA
ncbi:MAG TPA: 6-carboxytetrahydropterin synthase [Phycisphaerales bacterium]|nr:6-carboxytetrahydropterin synthase [Phycisphaerales bacterium]